MFLSAEPSSISSLLPVLVATRTVSSNARCWFPSLGLVLAKMCKITRIILLPEAYKGFRLTPQSGDNISVPAQTGDRFVR
jgi:hypothetical protein